jgi:thioredoxin 1
MFWRRGRDTREEAEFDVVDPPEDAALVTIDDGNFLASTEGGITIVDFWAPSCGPCRAFAPVFAEVAGRNADRARFARCNVDDSPTTATMLQIRSIPTVVAFGPDGSEVGRIVGVPPQAKLEAVIATLTEPA